MIVLKIIGWILLSILAIVIAALCFRIGFDVEYSKEQTAVDLKYLFLKIRLYPSDKSKKKEKKTDNKPEEAPAEETVPQTDDAVAEPSAETAGDPGSAAAETPGTSETVPADAKPEKKKDGFLKMLYDAEGVDGLITIVKKTLEYTKTFFGNFLHAVVVDRLWLDVRCTRSDAASTAIYYGEVCGILFPMLGSLASRCRIRKYDVNVYPDYLARFSEASFFVSLHMTPIYIVGITLAYVFKLLFGVLVGLLVKLFLPKKSEKKQEIQIKTKEKRENK